MKYDLKDVTFCIPVRLDSEIRSENLRISRDYLLNNFRILDMKSTLKSLNHNWDFQPEYIPCYITEQMYNEKYISKYNSLT